MKIKTLINNQKKLKKLLEDFKSKDYSKSLIGQKVRINKNFIKWITPRLDEIYTRPGETKPEETKEYLFQKKMLKERNVGTVVSVKKDDHVSLTLEIEFNQKSKKIKILFDLEDLDAV